MANKELNECITTIFSKEQENDSDIIIKTLKPNIIDIYCGDCPYWGTYYTDQEDYPCKKCCEQK